VDFYSDLILGVYNKMVKPHGTERSSQAA